MKSVLEIDSVMLEYGFQRILQDVHLKSETGNITGILGRNGTGKSSLMKILFGELTPDSKSIRLDGMPLINSMRSPQDMMYLPQNHFIPRSLSVARIFQDFDLNWNYFVHEFPGLETLKNKKLKNISGGERRIIEIYCIVASKTKFCLLDEPFSHVMPLHIDTLKKIITNEKSNKGIILTDHLYSHILDICDDLYVISNGKTYLTECFDDLKTLGYIRTLN